MKDFIQLLIDLVSKVFSMSVDKRNREADLHSKILEMHKENNLSSVCKDIIDEKSIKLLTGKDVNIRFAKKIQDFKQRLGGNVTDNQLYAIISFFKEDEDGKLYVAISKNHEILIKSYIILILLTIVFGLGLFYFLTENNDISLLFICLFMIVYYGSCLIFLNLIGSELTALQIKKIQDKLN
ncbi:MAG: hypothetical protein ACN6OB_23040 [Chryseobacterium jejuense]|uniref:hypothetical protein n=1 Tax=Chryseobacterium jejuense TaxID=445960 RepID=UPI003D12753D